ncbi:TetR/AcrR family transcriptional regulator [Sphaerisporangium corydalis]|uniref:TetR/AcrR family transcriptional regulator n=1 Tax=Sphaerisporangium corydalis TaxID=1441875 RepID=A0ABV9EML2_9ACTN|nr:TetR/AcrR family transcriptional regulator [Sphaerisporangium corydalis]
MVERGAARERAILTAVIAVVGEVGYEAMTMDAVAARAAASKNTIYRRWRNKAELARAALDAYDADTNATAPDTGTLRGDLVGAVELARDKATPAYMALIGGLVSATRHDPELKTQLREHTADDELSPFAAALRRAVDRSELPATVDEILIHDVAEALIVHRLTTGSSFDDDYVARIVDDVLLPLLTPKETS